jgi:hypothetical protein
MSSSITTVSVPPRLGKIEHGTCRISLSEIAKSETSTNRSSSSGSVKQIKEVYDSGTLHSSNCEKKKGTQVTFSTVEIRYHDMILGDNPDCKEGPPVQIGWKPYATRRFPFEQFEESRRDERRVGKGALQISPLQRHIIVKQSGHYKSEDIYDRIDEIEKIKNQRKRSLAGYKFKKWKQKFSLKINWQNLRQNSSTGTCTNRRGQK